MNTSWRKLNYQVLRLIGMIGAMSIVTGCMWSQSLDSASTQSQQSSAPAELVNVDTAIASLDSLTSTTEYVGTTEPIKQVLVSSPIEARLLDLSVDVGDRVSQGQVLGKLDDSLLAAAVSREQAELATLESELAQAKIGVQNAQIGLKEALIQLEQAKNDAQRYSDLVQTGLIAQQQAESYQTAAQVAEQAVFSAQEQVNIEEQAVAAALGRIAAQKAVIAEERQRQAYSELIAPISGIVTNRANEPGNLVQPGVEILSLGDFSQIKVVVPISELDLNRVAVGKEAQVELDAFPQQIFAGEVMRIAPVADANSRQVSIEVAIANPNRQINGGLLARVSFESPAAQKVVVPASAIVESEGTASIFVVTEEVGTRKVKVEKRMLQLGDRANGRVEVTKGIAPGERFIVRSSEPLVDNQTVGLSILSE